MLTTEQVQALALALPEATEAPHFHKTSFRVKKKIFATLEPATGRLVLKLSPVDQSVFISYEEGIFHPVAGTWGKQGWTTVDIHRVSEPMLQDALSCAWRAVAPQSLLRRHPLGEPDMNDL